MSTATVKALNNGQANGKEVKDGAAQQTPPAPQVQKTKQLSDLPPIEDRLHRLNMLYALQRKHSKYSESIVKLQEFNLKGDQESASLTIRDYERHEFSTSNPIIIRRVVEFMQKEIQAEIKALEPQIVW